VVPKLNYKQLFFLRFNFIFTELVLIMVYVEWGVWGRLPEGTETAMQVLTRPSSVTFLVAESGFQFITNRTAMYCAFPDFHTGNWCSLIWSNSAYTPPVPSHRAALSCDAANVAYKNKPFPDRHARCRPDGELGNVFGQLRLLRMSRIECWKLSVSANVAGAIFKASM
jgi:hypothetical protein